MLLGMEETRVGRMAGTEEGKGAVLPAWPVGRRSRALGSEALREASMGKWEVSVLGGAPF